MSIESPSKTNFEFLEKKEIDLNTWLKFFKNKDFCSLTSFEQQIYVLTYICDKDNTPLTISKIQKTLNKASSSVRRALKSLENKNIIVLKVHLSNEINRELTFIYLLKKLDFEKE
jgi:predicted transcriptional regulator